MSDWFDIVSLKRYKKNYVVNKSEKIILTWKDLNAHLLWIVCPCEKHSHWWYLRSRNTNLVIS